MKKYRRLIAVVLTVSMTGIGVPPPAQAGMIQTERAVATADRARLIDALDRADVRARLETLGVSPAEAKARVASLTDAEAAQLAGYVDNLPAGGDGGVGAIVGALLIVFLVLLLTDLLGYTKVFPFTKPMRK